MILVGSIASIKGFEAFSVYDASKAAVRSFAPSWIIDLKGRSIRVNVLSPRHIDTPGLFALMTDEQKASVVANVPMGRLCRYGHKPEHDTCKYHLHTPSSGHS